MTLGWLSASTLQEWLHLSLSHARAFSRIPSSRGYLPSPQPNDESLPQPSMCRSCLPQAKQPRVIDQVPHSPQTIWVLQTTPASCSIQPTSPSLLLQIPPATQVIHSHPKAKQGFKRVPKTQVLSTYPISPTSNATGEPQIIVATHQPTSIHHGHPPSRHLEPHLTWAGLAC